MKVAVDLTVEVDADLWASAYGLDPKDTKAIRYDVRVWAAQQLDNPTGESLIHVVRGL